jgi:predicted transposase YdaD
MEVYKMRAATFEEVFTEAGIIPEWMERGRAEGEARGEAKGRTEGERNKALSIAQNMVNMGLPAAQTAD